ncbi:DUF559 domain-containing protein [Myxococcota bacterium]|nr:DUF559 domain-containing protein [Myxococcota bacterium]
MPRQQPSATAKARALRRGATEPEQWLWQLLRGGRLGGHHFRRQHPLGPYVLDFYCPQARLAVELDGTGHLDRAEQDAARTAWLASQGVTVLRFWNDEVSGRPEVVLQAILDAIEEGRSGGGGG